ncbi:hypothetical protein FGIG_03283 [Fasciola gigantica]|uniref:Uncharacterized protein n=1 Tax=Fasciola gigantica TaxID=46835 RepID=A0A504YUU9_FASGI|nr:hypothetical protein FGIG_03283 [Fasciola gigantica]
MVQAKLNWNCPADKVPTFAGFPVECNVTYQWPDGVKRITFVDRIATSQLQPGFAQFNCFNKDSHYSQLFDRKIYNLEDFHTECLPSAFFVLGHTNRSSYRLCFRELNRTEPWISLIPEQDWPTQSIDCTETKNMLKIENGYLHLTNDTQAGQYQVVCTEYGIGTQITIVDSTVQLVALPKQNFFVLDGSVQPSFAFQSTDRSMKTQLIDTPDITCNLTTAPQIRFTMNEAEQPTLELDSTAFESTSAVHVVQCQALRGELVRSISLNLVARDGQRKELSTSTLSRLLFSTEESIPSASCRPSGNMEHAKVVWRRIHGDDMYISKLDTTASGSILFIRRNIFHLGPSSFVCQAVENDKCYSKLLIYYRYGGRNHLTIREKIRTQFFRTYLTCETDLTPTELNRYTWTVLLNSGVRWETESNQIKMFGSPQLFVRSYQRCQVDLLYLGQIYTTNSTVLFSEIHHRSEVEFLPELPVYKSSLLLRCRVTESDRYTSSPYMIFTQYPPTFRPLMFYRTVDFSHGFIGGSYTVTCYYINSNLILLSRKLEFIFHENPTAVMMQKTFDYTAEGRKRMKLKCVPNGYPPLVLDANWTVLSGSSFAFDQESQEFYTTKFALQGVYLVRCTVLVVFGDNVIRMNTTQRVVVEARDASDMKPAGCSSNIQFSHSIGISVMCWMLMYLNICTHLFKLAGQTARKTKKRQVSLGFVTYDTRILDRHCASQFRAVIRNFDTIQQITRQLIMHRQKARSTNTRRAERIKPHVTQYRRKPGWNERRKGIKPVARMSQ